MALSFMEFIRFSNWYRVWVLLYTWMVLLKRLLVIFHQWLSTNGNSHCNACKHCACYKVYSYALLYLIFFTMGSQGNTLCILIRHRFISLMPVQLCDNLGKILQFFYTFSFYTLIILELVDEAWERELTASFTFETLRYTFNFSLNISFWNFWWLLTPKPPAQIKSEVKPRPNTACYGWELIVDRCWQSVFCLFVFFMGL